MIEEGAKAELEALRIAPFQNVAAVAANQAQGVQPIPFSPEIYQHIQAVVLPQHIPPRVAATAGLSRKERGNGGHIQREAESVQRVMGQRGRQHQAGADHRGPTGRPVDLAFQGHSGAARNDPPLSISGKRQNFRNPPQTGVNII